MRAPSGKRILMASQRFGAGLSAVICVQNFWRWRLAKDADPQHFDRFWRQLFRFLSEPSRQEVTSTWPTRICAPRWTSGLPVETKAQALRPAGSAKHEVHRSGSRTSRRRCLDQIAGIAPRAARRHCSSAPK